MPINAMGGVRLNFETYHRAIGCSFSTDWQCAMQLGVNIPTFRFETSGPSAVRMVAPYAWSAVISTAVQPVIGWLYPLQPILRICNFQGSSDRACVCGSTISHSLVNSRERHFIMKGKTSDAR